VNSTLLHHQKLDSFTSTTSSAPELKLAASMAHSLSPECTPLKTSYDSCFNSWFAGYLEPTLSPQQQAHKEQHPEEYAKQKADEYQKKCGRIWESYRNCVQVRVHYHLPLLRGTNERAYHRYQSPVLNKQTCRRPSKKKVLLTS
jgi:TRIAP1/MDM35 family protein